MWSAPHQPFVLPVRVRSFEGLYRDNVKAELGAEALSEINAQRISRSVSGALKRLADDLRTALRGPGVRFIKVPDGLGKGIEGVGIKDGKLYYLIKDVKGAADPQPENQLKMPLMSLIFGEGAVKVARHPKGGEYYCASLADWTRVLGREPEVTDG